MRASRAFPVRPRQKAKKKKVITIDPHVESRICAYCGKAASTRDHVVPKSFIGRDALPAALRATVAACLDCNLLKGNRALIPASWSEHIGALREAYPGRAWRVWDGNTRSKAYFEVWI